MCTDTKQKLPVCVGVKCWHSDAYMNVCDNEDDIKALSTVRQWTSGHDTNIIYHNRELSGQSTSLWESWCDAQTKMMPGYRVACLDKAKQRSFQKILPFKFEQFSLLF